MEQILENKTVRRLFFLLFGSLFVIYWLIRWVVVGKPTAAMMLELADKFTISLAVTITIGLFLFYVTPRFVKSRQLKVAVPDEIKGLFAELPQVSTSWCFKGATGRYVRSKVIPKFAELSKADRKIRSITLVLLNPRNAECCSEYAEYRNSTHIASDTWSSTRVREEILATILVAISFRSSLLAVKVALLESFSSFRYDLTDSVVVVTKEDPASVALICTKDQQFYSYFELDAHVTYKQGKEVSVKDHAINLDSCSHENVAALLANLRLIEHDFDEVSLKRVLHLARERRSPYPA
jgi:hypothetical protein